MIKKNISSLRSSNIELLRIISMLMIVMGHFVQHSQLLAYARQNLQEENCFLIVAMGMFAQVGVIIFALISGYYQSFKENLSYRKPFKLLRILMFYSIFLFLVAWFYKLTPISTKNIIGALLPLGLYWFIFSYIVFALFAPYINKILMQLSYKEYKFLVLLTFLTFVVIPFFMYGHVSWSFGSVGIFFCSFLIGGYLKKYGGVLVKLQSGLTMTIVSFILMITSIPVMGRYGFDVTYLGGTSSVIAWVLAVGMFVLFAQFKFQSKTVNTIAGTMLGVYLIHENREIREWIWNIAMPNIERITSNAFVVFAFFKILIVFMACVFIEYMRQIISKNIKILK